jgi:GNAT superfamily N-acetyltransferase
VIVFQSLDAGDDGFIAEVYRLYAEAFDPREQKSRDQLAALRGRPDYEILVARRGGRIVGFSVLFVPPGEPFSLLEYMAVEAAERGGGVGAELFRQSRATAAARQGGRPVAMLVEVDSDRITSPAQELCEKRQRFYRRLGCLRIEGLPYELPLPMEVTPPEMDLLVHLPPERTALAKSELEHWLQVVYRKVYGCAPDDSRPRRMLERVVDPVGLV